MRKCAPCFVLILLEILLFLVNNSTCRPSVSLEKTQIFGQTIEFDKYKVNKYLRIRYAQPPVGALRFQKTEKIRNIPSRIEAVDEPPACMQYSESPYPWYVNGSHKSEDCLFLNIWTPADASTSNQKAVMFWMHGGGFKFGSIQNPLYNGTALAALGDIIVVTTNYRLGVFGFLTTDTDEAPGNAGYWDVLQALTWVNENIRYFGGDTSRITIGGVSAGSAAAGALSISPLSDGLFSQIIMESGSPIWPAQETKHLNLALAQKIAVKVKCATDSDSLEENPQSVTKCLKNVKAKDLEQAEFELAPGATSLFFPQYGDEFLPKKPSKAVYNREFRCRRLLIGNTLDEGSVSVSTTSPKEFGFFGEKVTNPDQPVSKEVVDKLLDPLLPDLKSSVHDNPQNESGLKTYYLDKLLKNAYNSTLRDHYTLLGDIGLLCPDEYFAEKCAEIGGDVYFYFFVHRSSSTPWARWMGAAHYEELQYVFGKPLLQPSLYIREERRLSKYIIKIWSNFVKTGKPNKKWPLYSKENQAFKYLGRRKSMKKYGKGPHKHNCDLYRHVANT